MIEGKKILWGINVYSRVNHLRVQEELIRAHFGDKLDILLFTNHESFPEKNFRYKEDIFHRHDVNSGGHTGCRDAYNFAVPISVAYDYIIWSHADCILGDYSIVEKMLCEMKDADAVFYCLSQDRQVNPRRNHEGVVPHIYNDFFIFESSFYREVFPRYDICDGWAESGLINDCIEVALGKWVAEKIGSRKHIVLPGKLDSAVPDESIFKNDGKAYATRGNSFEACVNFLRSNFPKYYHTAAAAGLTTNLLDDKR